MFLSSLAAARHDIHGILTSGTRRSGCDQLRRTRVRGYTCAFTEFLRGWRGAVHARVGGVNVIVNV